jgi:protein-tyrosine-phosphatase
MFASKRLLILLTILAFSAMSHSQSKDLNPPIAAYIKARVAEFDQIPADRKAELRKLALYIRSQLAAKQEPKLVFICTHNSRRSHLAQIWAQTAAQYYGVAPVRTYSGGLQATAFNPRAVAALQRAGFDIQKTSEGDNPVYQVRFGPSVEPMTAFSKVYDQDPNPKSDFAAVMTCANADKNCPVVNGASLRVPTHYEDPKDADGTPQETQVYDERTRQISREVLYAFSQVKG